jgi:L-alanine-DL-glutamate epimerase-like enolase superfamily enzyme
LLHEYMRDYGHWSTLGVLCELLPQPDNRVTLADEVDAHGVPVARFDVALHDLRARLLGLPLARALGAFRDAVPVYGSGGFTSYSLSACRSSSAGGRRGGSRA